VRPSNRSIPFGAKRLNRRKVPRVRGWVFAPGVGVGIGDVPSVDQPAREGFRMLRLFRAWNTREREGRDGAQFVWAAVPCR
jgi:hypothetical protein